MTNPLATMAASKASRTRRQMVAGDPSARDRDDFYSTPTEGTLALLSVEKFYGSIAEPACGMGHISKVLIDLGYNVWSSDLVDRGYGAPRIDFLMNTYQVDNIITNPPFKLAVPFVLKALELTKEAGGKVAMLLKTTFFESMDRSPVMDEFPPSRFYPFADRLQCLRGNDEKHGIGGGMMSFTWFVWDHRATGPLTMPCRLRAADFAATKALAHPSRRKPKAPTTQQELFQQAQP